MSFKLPDLPYPHDALAPYMSRETLEYHHDKHHNAYVTPATSCWRAQGLRANRWRRSSRAPSARMPASSTMPASITTTCISGNG